MMYKLARGIRTPPIDDWPAFQPGLRGRLWAYSRAGASDRGVEALLARVGIEYRHLPAPGLSDENHEHPDGVEEGGNQPAEVRRYAWRIGWSCRARDHLPLSHNFAATGQVVVLCS